MGWLRPIFRPRQNTPDDLDRPSSCSSDRTMRSENNVENYLHDQVCSGAIALKQAQIDIAHTPVELLRLTSDNNKREPHSKRPSSLQANQKLAQALQGFFERIWRKFS